MFKVIIVSCVLLFSTYVNCQSVGTVEGVINDINGVPIPFSLITIENKNHGSYSNENGSFKLDNVKIGDTLTAESIGFYSDFVVYNGQLRINFSLKFEDYDIEIINVSDSALGNSKSIKVGSFSKKSRSTVRANSGYVVVTLIENKIQRDGFLSSIRLWADPLNRCSNIIRMRIFEVDSNLRPGSELSPDNKVIVLKGNNKVHNIDVSSKKIIIPPNGVYIGFEFIDQSDDCKVDGTTKSRYLALGFNYSYSEYRTYRRFGSAPWQLFKMRSINSENVPNLNVDLLVNYVD